MVHGRYDIVCPLKQAYDLNFVYPKSQLSIINDAGHSLLESGTTRKILEIFSKPNELIS
jgi:proline iminopeptidase